MSTENKETIIIDGTSINEDINSVVSVEEKHNLDDEDNEFQDEDNESGDEQEEIAVISEEENLYQSYKHLIEQVVKFNKEIHTMMTILRYQYDHLSLIHI